MTGHPLTLLQKRAPSFALSAQLITSSTTMPVPPGAVGVIGAVVAAGGGGGGGVIPSSLATQPGASGAGAGQARDFFLTIPTGTASLTLTVGAGGTGGLGDTGFGGTNGGAGGLSKVVAGANSVVAYGGGPGISPTADSSADVPGGLYGGGAPGVPTPSNPPRLTPGQGGTATTTGGDGGTAGIGWMMDSGGAGGASAAGMGGSGGAFDTNTGAGQQSTANGANGRTSGHGTGAGGNGGHGGGAAAVGGTSAGNGSAGDNGFIVIYGFVF